MNTNFTVKKIDPQELVIIPFYEPALMPPTESFVINCDTFNYYGYPVVTKDNIVLNNFDSVMAAKTRERDFFTMDRYDIDVVVAEGIDESNMIEFVFHCLLHTKATHYQKFLRLSFLRKYLKEDEYGKKWAKRISGDMHAKLSTITGISESLLKMILRIGNNDRNLFALIESGESSLRKEYDNSKSKIAEVFEQEDEEVEEAGLLVKYEEVERVLSKKAIQQREILKEKRQKKAKFYEKYGFLVEDCYINKGEEDDDTNIVFEYVQYIDHGNKLQIVFKSPSDSKTLIEIIIKKPKIDETNSSTTKKAKLTISN